MQCSVSVFVLCLCVHSCVCVHACVCMCVRVHVRACAVQPASSANALWKTNSVSVDGVSRQRSSSDPPAVHPPLPPLRVTSTSTFFPFSFLASGLFDLDGWGVLSAAARGQLRRCTPASHCREPSTVFPALAPPAALPSCRLLSVPHPMPGGCSHTLLLCLPEHFGNISSCHA